MRTLLKLELCNLYGLNVLRFSRDGKRKRKSMLLLAVWMFLLALLFFYMGGLSYGLIYLGLEEAVLPYLTVIASLLIFFFGILKAGGAIFSREGYDILCALPVTKTAVAASRLVRMYVENLLMALAVLLPGILVYAWNIRPGVFFYMAALLTVAVPLIPMAGAILIGTLVARLVSRMRHKSLAAAGLTILAVLAVLYGLSRISAVSGEADVRAIKEMSAYILASIGNIYPPAVWIGQAAGGRLLFAGVSLAAFAAAAAVVFLFFDRICQSLCSNSARHDYEMGRLKARPVLLSLCRRECQRYFSSSVYVTNTIIGPIMGCILSGVLLVAGGDAFEKILPLPINVGELAPFAVAGAFCTMTTTSVSISMEGKNWWILKSLPLTEKSILDAKILMNLLVFLPFYALAEVLLLAAMKPDFAGAVWMLLIPAVVMLFSCVWGVAANLYFPVLEWENEVRVVKQSASALAGALGGLSVAVLGLAGVCLAPERFLDIYKGGFCLVILAVTAFLYKGKVFHSQIEK